MPGPKMGPRPDDFCEDLVRQSPTFARWATLNGGEKLRYACRDFVKGHDQDEERLMRRIMIARRNNLRDHAILKKARRKSETGEEPPEEIPAPVPDPSPRKRKPASAFSDSQVAREMDVAAVESTRSYRAWMSLPDGAEFIYNQRYYKGRPNQDWLLRKNIWRRMRYRRENKKMVNLLREDDPNLVVPDPPAATVSEIDDPALKQDDVVPRPTDFSTGTKRPAENTGGEFDRPSQLLKTDDAIPAFPNVTDNNPDMETAAPHQDPVMFPHTPSFKDDDDTAALTAAAAATASGDDLVELSAVEAAVAAAETYVQFTTTHEGEEDHSVGPPSVHNPIEAAANAAALDSAAQLAAAATAQEIEAAAVQVVDDAHYVHDDIVGPVVEEAVTALVDCPIKTEHATAV